MVLKITNLHILRYLPTCWLYLLERYAIDNQRCTHTASEGKSDYESGFQPAYSGYVVNEMSDMSRFLPFGDTNEALLSTALGAIDGSIQPPAQEDTRSLRVTTLANSIERRASHAVRIK